MGAACVRAQIPLEPVVQAIVSTLAAQRDIQKKSELPQRKKLLEVVTPEQDTNAALYRFALSRGFGHSMSSQVALAVFLLGSEHCQYRMIEVPKIRCLSHFRYARMSGLIPG